MTQIYTAEQWEKRLANQRKYRKENGNMYTNKYERTLNGFLMRKYRNMKSRVMGIQKMKAHLYTHKDLLSKKDFYNWANSSPDLFLLYGKWLKSGFDRKLCPTVDRIDSNKGYVPSNMRWITHSQNSQRGGLHALGIRYGKNLMNKAWRLPKPTPVVPFLMPQAPVSHPNTP